jgi:hypothetical protein
MVKRLYGVAVIVSLIICLSAGILWGVCYDGHNSVIRTRYLPPDPDIPGKDFIPVGVRSTEVIGIIDGEFILGASRTPARGVRPTSGWHLFMLPSRNLVGEESFLHRLGLDLSKQTTPQGKSLRLRAPMSAVVGLTAILPLCWYVGWSRERAARLRLCAVCGSNLTDLIVNNCPNCGTPTPQVLPPPTNVPAVLGVAAR